MKNTEGAKFQPCMGNKNTRSKKRITYTFIKNCSQEGTFSQTFTSSRRFLILTTISLYIRKVTRKFCFGPIGKIAVVL